MELSLTASLMLRQQSQCLLRLTSSLEDGSTHNLDSDVIGRRRSEFLNHLGRRIGLSECTLCKSTNGQQLGLRLALDLAQNLLRLAECYAGPQDQDSGGELILRRKGGCIEIDDFLVLSLVKVVVDIDQFAFGGIGVHVGRLVLLSIIKLDVGVQQGKDTTQQYPKVYQGARPAVNW